MFSIIVHIILIVAIFAGCFAVYKKVAGNNVNIPVNKRAIRRVLAGIVLLFLFFNSWYQVSETEYGVVTTFGKPPANHNTAGLYFKIPIAQKVIKVDRTTHGVGVGYTLETGQNIPTDDGIMITADMNLLNIDFYMEYLVSDPIKYLFASDNPEYILMNIALAVIRSTVSDYNVDEAMTTGKGKIQAEVKEGIAKKLLEEDIGLSIVNIQVQDSAPPTDDVRAEFRNVETAKQGADAARNKALEDRNNKIPQADANADKLIQEAEATKSARIAEAEGQVARFNQMYLQYKRYPGITKKRIFYEAMEDILPDLKVIVTDGETEELLPLGNFSTQVVSAE